MSQRSDINKSWAKFYSILNGVVRLCVPVCKRGSHKTRNKRLCARTGCDAVCEASMRRAAEEVEGAGREGLSGWNKHTL